MFRTTNFDRLLDKATSHLQLEPDWPTILQISDLIRQNDVQPKQALAAIKKKLTNPNPHVASYALLVLESCVKNCGSRIQDEIATKQYMEQLKELVKSSTHEHVRQKIFELIQAWAYAFRNIPKYRAVQDTLNIMKSEGHIFPTLQESDAMFMADTAPEWTNGDVCHRCRITFTFLQRKHHCRACGQVFCAHCSSKVSTLPKIGFEKEVRVCEACFEQVNKPSTTQSKETDLPAEYLSSSLAQQQQVPPRKTEDEIREEEDLQLAIALSQSEAEQKEREKKRATNALKSNAVSVSKTTYSPPPSPGPSLSRIQDEEEIDPELAKYLNRRYWEQRQTAIEEHSARTDVTSPSAPNISSPMPQKIVIAKQQNGEVDIEMEEFVNALRSQVEIFVNRMKSNSSRGRPITSDSSVQNLFLNITRMHSRLLTYIQEQDDSRVYYEGLQDKLTQIKDARAALDALRDEHREKLRRQAEEAERQRQMLMAQKLAIMRKKKQDYLQYQRQLALQKIQEQEREMQMRQEQQKQQYIMSGYQSMPGYMGHSQGSPVRQMQYQGPGSNYNPMSPTDQGVYMYGQHSMGQYPIQGYNMPPMSSLPPHIIGTMTNQESTATDSAVQSRENVGRVVIANTGMIPQVTNPITQLQQPTAHQIGTAQQGTATHIPVTQVPPSHMPQGPHTSQISGLPNQIGIAQSVPSTNIAPPPPRQIVPATHGPPGQVVLPPQIGPQPIGIPIPQGAPVQQHVSAIIPSQRTTAIQVSAAGGTGMVPSSQSLQGPTGPNLNMQGMTQISATQGQPFTFPQNSAPPAAENTQAKEEPKPETAELISFD
ncbi:hepatocyte growth factor-regulated tyrosine kinase substrate [Vespula pensylvanica]|uniref:hepatocyte growth factor-regulated tyrosine kinase substrate n=1 Tax=Vespula pensylvanica TaxID=30213 RepID=UPI001CBA4F82|nr:hepatocyte growth factor-regulated tyrosine kinase substrate [Vespula pensylvanica]